MIPALNLFDRTTMERNRNLFCNAPIAFRWVTIVALVLCSMATMTVVAQSTNTYATANLYTAGASCSFSDLDVAGSYTPTYNPGTCGASNFDDSWGRFVATSTTTVVTFDPDDNHRPSCTCSPAPVPVRSPRWPVWMPA